MPSIKLSVRNGLRQKFRDMAYSITGKEIPIYAIPREEGELGYTSKDGGIHVSFDHPIIDKVQSAIKRIAFATGVFVHELLHKILTPFELFCQTANRLPERQRKIFHVIYNCMEDNAIEEMARFYIGGTPLECLHFTRTILYQQAEPLGPGDPLSQFISALIMYGDGGSIKGEFTEPEARNVFYKALPIINKTNVERDRAQRVQNAYEVFLLAKPLWEPVLRNQQKWENLAKALAESMANSGKGTSGTGGTPIDVPADFDAKDPAMEKKNKRRKITFKRIEKEEMEELKKNGSDGSPDDGESDLTVLYCDDDDNQNGESSPGGQQGPQSGSASGEGKDTPSSNNAAPGAQQGPQSGSASGEGKDAPSSNNAASGASEGCGEAQDGFDVDHEPDYDKEATSDDEDYELSADALKQIEQMTFDIELAATAEKTASDASHAEDLSESAAIKACYAGARCLNKRVKSNLSDALQAKYNNLLLLLSEGVNFLVNHMKRIIKKDTEDREYRNSGKLNVKRLSSGRLTSRVFNRRFDPANTSDMCVEILVDESGSMQCDNKSTCAMQCVVGLAEAFSRLHIPLKVIGYTADIGGYDAVHYHYMHWLNTPAERANLLSITHRCDNFDGYSIRYGTEMLLKRKEQHKIMIIISDGHPAALYYRSRSAGIEDTIDAIKQARKKVDVIGVGIGSANTAVWEAMYGSDFVHVKNANELFKRIGYEIQKKMKKWE